MKHTLAPLLTLAAISIFSIGCQTAAPDRKLTDAKPTSATPLPAWTKRADKIQSDQQVMITTKIIEITRSAGAADTPKKRYERKLTDSQYQVLIRQMSQTKGTDLMTAPSVVTRDGQKATVEVIREFIYPIAPGEDAKKETENVGVTNHIEARHVGGNKISIKTFTRVCEFDSFFQVTPEFELPVFNRRDATASAMLKSGETILVGGIVDEVSQVYSDSGPLGIIKRYSTAKFSRELIVAVTATLVNPDGARMAAR